jgi:tRNA threonylcarbamoyladenosine biosynthesis protein TsaB
MPVFSFYHFDVPRFCGIEKGYWVTNAFKGQVFIYNWDGDQTERHLVAKESYAIEDKKNGFRLDTTDESLAGLTTTKELIKNESQKLFSYVVKESLRVPPYYFRSLEEEFR